MNLMTANKLLNQLRKNIAIDTLVWTEIKQSLEQTIKTGSSKNILI